MKKPFLLLAVMAFVATSFAQQFSGGLRSGASLWLAGYQEKKLRNTKGQNITWDNGLFLRYDSKKRFAMEVGFAHYYYRNDLSENPTDPNVHDDWYTEYEHNQYVNNYELELNFQFDLSCKKLKACTFLKNLENNIGLSIIPTLANTRYSRLYSGGHWDYVPLTYRSGVYKEFKLYAGLTHTLKYNINNGLYLTSKASISLDPDYFQEYGLDYVTNYAPFIHTDGYARFARASMQVGIGYNF